MNLAIGLRVVAPLLALILGTCSSAPPPKPRPPGTGAIAVTIQGFENDDGHAFISLFLNATGFPSEHEKAYAGERRLIQNGKVDIIFDEVPAGSFAVSVFHDQDANLELNTGVLGIPTERWGVSKDASGFMGPPSYESAELQLAPGEEKIITIRIG